MKYIFYTLLFLFWGNQVLSQIKLTDIIDNIEVRGRSINIETSDPSDIFSILRIGHNFQFKTNRILFLKQIDKFNLFVSFNDEYLLDGLESDIFLQAHQYYLFDTLANKFFFIQNERFNNFHKESSNSISIEHNISLSKCYIKNIVELNEELKPINAISITGFVLEKNMEEGDLLSRTYFYTNDNKWYNKISFFKDFHLNINDITYECFLELMSRINCSYDIDDKVKIECNPSLYNVISFFIK